MFKHRLSVKKTDMLLLQIVPQNVLFIGYGNLIIGDYFENSNIKFI